MFRTVANRIHMNFTDELSRYAGIEKLSVKWLTLPKAEWVLAVSTIHIVCSDSYTGSEVTAMMCQHAPAVPSLSLIHHYGGQSAGFSNAGHYREIMHHAR